MDPVRDRGLGDRVADLGGGPGVGDVPRVADVTNKEDGKMMPDVTGELDVSLDFTLEKFEGEKVPGDGKEPFQILKGGDGKPTMIVRDDYVDLDEPREWIAPPDETETQPEKE